jgi:hypothetical protein
MGKINCAEEIIEDVRHSSCLEVNEKVTRNLKMHKELIK